MIHQGTIEERVAAHYGVLSAQLRRAADYVVANPFDLATLSLRTISANSHVSPATFSRLSRALGYGDFAEMKEQSRHSVGQQVLSFSEKAEALRANGDGDGSILERQSSACIDNIHAMTRAMDETRLKQAAECLRNARQVLLFGALGSTGIVEYMAYLARYFAPNWTLTGRMGDSLGASVATLAKGDAVLIVTKTPYVHRAVVAARLAREQGADVVLFTDLPQSPAIPYASHAFVVPSESPQFFSSYAATLVLVETLIAMIVASSGEETTASIRKVEAENRALGEYWSDGSDPSAPGQKE